ncbi:MAG: GNAT family N-acetyltransferase [Acidobacteriota bacterium]
MFDTEKLSLRPNTPDDDGFLRQVYDSTRRDELDAWGWDAQQQRLFLDLQFKAQTEQYRQCYPKADSELILLNGNPVGRILIDRGETDILLIDIALLAEYRRLGIGTYLIRGLLDEARTVRLQVQRSNPALRLYQRLGFLPIAGDQIYIEMEWRAKPAR